MRSLLPHPSDDIDLHRSYADDWLDDGGLRVNFVSSVDGGVSAGGKSRGLQTPGDNKVFAALRDLADVVLVGSGTATAEGYGAVTFSERRRAVRREYGLAETMPVAVLSRSLRLDPASGLFTDAQPGARTIVLTSRSADADRRRALEQVADVVDCGDDSVDAATARAALEARGLTRILCEGGPSIFADFAAAGVVDELCLTLSPLLVGPGPGRIVGGSEWGDVLRLRLSSLLAEDDALFCRYSAVHDGTL